MEVEVASFKGSRFLEVLLVSVTVDVNNTELELDVLHFTSASWMSRPWFADRPLTFG